ncbi:topoisomerase DNA-binding C4 zinc finger domain-containing protein [Flavobacterium sp.]|uniref:topoisomerase DNA-binding C4 zinc finger domain-containing protein n=1 Tax=Flavobacterium sp. TaxID=239 RepID=UPI003FA5ECB8
MKFQQIIEYLPVCDQTFNTIAILEDSILCSGCMSGFMVKRSGKYGAFLGCTNYPKCENIVKLGMGN